jgi:LemA protein
LLIALVILGVIILVAIMRYNKLVALRNAVKNNWSQANTQLQRRFDLIPNLVETVKGYAAHEKGVFEAVAQARTAFLNANSVQDTAVAENMMTGALKSLFAVAENYPQLQASQNFMMLQEELAGTEDKVSYARQSYNNAVLEYNTTIEQFPTNLLAALFNFKQQEFFEVEEEARKAVKVEF